MHIMVVVSRALEIRRLRIEPGSRDAKESGTACRDVKKRPAYVKHLQCSDQDPCKSMGEQPKLGVAHLNELTSWLLQAYMQYEDDPWY